MVYKEKFLVSYFRFRFVTQEIMADHGYINFYTPPEYEPYQQYQQNPSEDEWVSNMENILNMFMQQFMINMQDTTER